MTTTKQASKADGYLYNNGYISRRQYYAILGRINKRARMVERKSRKMKMVS